MFARDGISVIVLWALSQAHAGAWTREAGSVYAKTSLDLYGSSHYVDPRGETIDASYLGKQVGAYAEVGILDRLQATVQVPFTAGTSSFPVVDGTVETGTGHATSVRLGDAWVQLQTGLLEKPVHLALAAEAKVPLYQNDSIGRGGGVYRGYFPLPGDGQIDLGAWLWAGGSFPHSQVWGQVGSGYRYRSSWFLGWITDVDFSDGAPMRAQLGLGTNGRWLALSADAFVAFQDDDVTREWLSVGPGGGWKLGDSGLSLEARLSFDVWTSHSSQGVGGGVGLSWTGPSDR